MIRPTSAEVDAALDAWDALCRVARRRSLSCRAALEGDTTALQRALDALGYPAATTDPGHLSRALRRLVWLPGASDRRLCRSAGSGGVSQWYVVR